MKQLAVFASGSGSNFEAIVTAAKKGELNAAVSLLVCDKPEAYVIARARAHHIPVFCFSPAEYGGKALYEAAILERLKRENIQFIALAGYMRIVGKTLLEAYPQRIINIHPSLLPAFPGKDAIQRAYESAVEQTGVTVHYVDAGVDTGPVILQQPVAIKKEDTLESLTETIHRVEHRLYVQALRRLLEN